MPDRLLVEPLNKEHLPTGRPGALVESGSRSSPSLGILGVDALTNAPVPPCESKAGKRPEWNPGRDDDARVVRKGSGHWRRAFCMCFRATNLAGPENRPPVPSDSVAFWWDETRSTERCAPAGPSLTPPRPPGQWQAHTQHAAPIGEAGARNATCKEIKKIEANRTAGRVKRRLDG